MTRFGIKTAGALVLAGMLCAASPAFADHDDDRHWRGRGHWHHHEHHGDWNGRRFAFCAASCKRTFDDDPEKYAEASTPA